MIEGDNRNGVLCEEDKVSWVVFRWSRGLQEGEKGGRCSETLGDGGGWRRFREREPASKPDVTYQCSAFVGGRMLFTRGQ